MDLELELELLLGLDLVLAPEKLLEREMDGLLYTGVSAGRARDTVYLPPPPPHFCPAIPQTRYEKG